MNYKKSKAPTSTITRDVVTLSQQTGNRYKMVEIIGRRSNQISAQMKSDLQQKLQEFTSYNDNLEEIFENKEQIEISRYYERLPKSVLIATEEYINEEVYFRSTKDETK